MMPPEMEWLATQNEYFRHDGDTLFRFFAPRRFVPVLAFQKTMRDCECGCLGGTGEYGKTGRRYDNSDFGG